MAVDVAKPEKVWIGGVDWVNGGCLESGGVRKCHEVSGVDLEVEPKLTDVVGDLCDGEDAASGVGGSVGAGVPARGPNFVTIFCQVLKMEIFF